MFCCRVRSREQHADFAPLRTEERRPMLGEVDRHSNRIAWRFLATPILSADSC